uniref:39S ribosomal protein L23, mitochondrial n=1 Tax=Anser cygnoides TaxID=8845 RepID=A0A8B9IEE7_ANSCY
KKKNKNTKTTLVAPPLQQRARAGAPPWRRRFRAWPRPWRRAAGGLCERGWAAGEGRGRGRWSSGRRPVVDGRPLPAGTRCSSWAAPSCGSSAPTSSCWRCGPACRSPRTRCSSASPWSANNKKNHKNQRVKKPDYKVAYVQLGKGQTFQFPNLFPEKEQDEEARSFDDFRKKYLEKEQQIQKGDPRRGGVPDWFGL